MTERVRMKGKRRGVTAPLAVARVAIAMNVIVSCSFVALPAAAEMPYEFAWVQGIGGESFDLIGLEVAADSVGGAYLAGRLSDAVAYGSSNVIAGPTQMVLGKFDPAGSVEWVRTATVMGDPPFPTSSAAGVALDPEGNIVVTGNIARSGTGTNKSIYFTATDSLAVTNPRGSEIYVAKYTSDGEFLWARSTGGNNGAAQRSGIATDATGAIYVTGTVESAGDFLLAKLDPDGNVLWRRYATGAYVHSDGVKADPAGNCYLECYVQCTNETFSIGGVTVTNAGTWSAAVVKFDPAGQVDWLKVSVHHNTVAYHALALDSATNVLVVGSAAEDVIFGIPTGLATTNTWQPYVVKFSPAGETLWVSRIKVPPAGGPHMDGFGLTVDTADNVYITGVFHDSGDFGSFSLTNQSRTVLIAKYSPMGTALWAHVVGGSPGEFPGSSSGSGISAAAGPDGIFVSGVYSGTATFGSFVVPNAGAADTFLAKLAYHPPRLEVYRAGDDAVLTWPDFPAGYQLQSTEWITNPGSWTNHPGTSVTADGSNNVNVPLSVENQYFRLWKP
jgi:hypothetical protein